MLAEILCTGQAAGQRLRKLSKSARVKPGRILCCKFCAPATKFNKSWTKFGTTAGRFHQCWSNRPEFGPALAQFGLSLVVGVRKLPQERTWAQFAGHFAQILQLCPAACPARSIRSSTCSRHPPRAGVFASRIFRVRVSRVGLRGVSVVLGDIGLLGAPMGPSERGGETDLTEPGFETTDGAALAKLGPMSAWPDFGPCSASSARVGPDASRRLTAPTLYIGAMSANYGRLRPE